MSPIVIEEKERPKYGNAKRKGNVSFASHRSHSFFFISHSGRGSASVYGKCAVVSRLRRAFRQVLITVSNKDLTLAVIASTSYKLIVESINPCHSALSLWVK